MNAEQLVQFAKKNNIKYVQFHFSDLLGNLRSMEESVDLLESILAGGLSVDGSSVPGYAIINESDIALIPEPETFTSFKIDAEYSRIMCHIKNAKGEPHPGDPRGILQKVIEKANSLGFKPYAMSELEFYLFDEKGSPIDKGGYLSVPPYDRALTFRRELAEVMTTAELKVKRIHHEVGPGQNEVELQITDAMKNADDTLTGIWITKLKAYERGYIADFMPKPIEKEAGNGLHQHVLLKDLKGNNVFASDEGLSEIAKHFIAGLITHAGEITAVFARSKQSFERLKPGYEAPVYAIWDYMNRSALIRVPYIAKGEEHKTRVEFRAGDASGSIHLLEAMLFAAGLDGIEKKLECPDNVNLDLDKLCDAELKKLKIKRLPKDLKETKHIMEESKFIEEVIGKHAKEFFLARYD